MALGCKVYNAIHIVLLHQFKHLFKVADIGLYKGIVGGILNILEIRKIARIGQLVYVYYMIVGILVHEKAHHMTTDEAGTACYHYTTFHINEIICC